MREDLVKRILEEAKYIIETKKTVRELATIFNVSKSTVHKDLQERLEKVSPLLHIEVKKILFDHTMIRHLRGGEATKTKYLKLKG